MIKYRIIGEEDFKISSWSGGETRELIIYPEDSSLDRRDFIYRISSASVEVEESEFSNFTGYQRFICPLEGEMSLDHENRHKADLREYEVDYFLGAWKTRSRGKCRDFNLIIKEGLDAEMLLLEDQYTSSGDRIYIYCHGRSALLNLKTADDLIKIELGRGKLLELVNDKKEEVFIRIEDGIGLIGISLDL